MSTQFGLYTVRPIEPIQDAFGVFLGDRLIHIEESRGHAFANRVFAESKANRLMMCDLINADLQRKGIDPNNA